DPQNPTLQLKGLPTPLNPGAIAQPSEQFPPVPPPTEPQPAETRPPRPDTPTANRRTRPPRGSTPPPIPTTKKQPQPQPPLQNPTTCSDSACQHSHGGNSGSTTPTQTNGSNNGNCKYCNCCYCELFGNGGPPQAPVSKNFQEIRARLRRKLKKGKSDGGSDAKDEGRSDNDNVSLETSSPVHHSPEHLLPPQKICDQQQPSLDELVSFIEGQKISEEERSKKAAKRARQKQRKETDKKKSDLVEKQIDPIPETQRMEVEMSKEEEPKYPKDHGGAEGDKNGRKKKKKKAKEVQEEEFYSQKPAQKNSSGDLK
uniref:FAM193 C-terminal domain-containing protein n=1 Tax=Ciona savignyi TaxID=51511 RepID=H2ZLC8_CIOSA